MSAHQTEGFYLLNFFSVIHSGVSRDVRVHMLAYLHDQIQTAHYMGGALKVRILECNASFLCHLSVLSGVSKWSHGGMDK